MKSNVNSDKMVTLAMQWQTAVSLTNDGESLTSDHRLGLSVFLPFVCLLIVASIPLLLPVKSS